ncbi:hypothetical protein Tco_1248780 [Tanacetum coccineum]
MRLKMRQMGGGVAAVGSNLFYVSYLYLGLLPFVVADLRSVILSVSSPNEPKSRVFPPKSIQVRQFQLGKPCTEAQATVAFVSRNMTGKPCTKAQATVAFMSGNMTELIEFLVL